MPASTSVRRAASGEHLSRAEPESSDHRLAQGRIQLSYTGAMPEEIYAFTERTYANLAKAHVSPLSVMDVLYGRSRVRRHIGASLQVAGQDRDGTWLVVALVEGPMTSTP